MVFYAKSSNHTCTDHWGSFCETVSFQNRDANVLEELKHLDAGSSSARSNVGQVTSQGVSQFGIHQLTGRDHQSVQWARRGGNEITCLVEELVLHVEPSTHVLAEFKLMTALSRDSHGLVEDLLPESRRVFNLAVHSVIHLTT